jgi:branched-chain amino acid transport system permease protein
MSAGPHSAGSPPAGSPSAGSLPAGSLSAGSASAGSASAGSGSARRWAAIAAAVLLAGLLPLAYHDPYILTVIVTAEIVAILNISWSFLLGMAGVWNFGQLAVYALGAYSSGWLMLHAHRVPVALAILLGGLFSAVVSVLLAFPTLRLFGIYTSLLTFSFSQVVQAVAVNNPGGLTGGTFGFPPVPGLFPNLGHTAYLRAYYWLCAGVIVISCLAVAWLRQSHLGIALRSIRDAPAYTAARGVDPRAARVAAFGISGFLAGIAGSLYLCFQQSFTTSQMGLTPMSIDVTMLVIGGLGTVFGPLIGTAVLTTIQTLLIDYPGWQLTVLGVILLVIVVFVPGGLVGVISRTARRVSAWVAEDEQDADEPPPAVPDPAPPPDGDALPTRRMPFPWAPTDVPRPQPYAAGPPASPGVSSTP